jgi:hypothetical protein
LASGIYIPPDDRRYDVIESATMVEMGIQDEMVRRQYFSDLWDWFLEGGGSHIAAFLHERDISGFSASNGQRKTEAHKTVVAGGMTGDHWLIEILDSMGMPEFVREDWILTRAVANGEKDEKVKGKIMNTMGRQDYHMYYNPAYKHGRWSIGGKMVIVYAKSGTPVGKDPSTVCAQEPF